MTTRLRVLVVCDDWEACERYEHELREAFEVEPVIFASDAAERAREFAPERLVVDLFSQDCTPEEFAQLRANRATLAAVPAVIVGTGPATEGVRWLARPFTYSGLIELLRQ